MAQRNSAAATTPPCSPNRVITLRTLGTVTITEIAYQDRFVDIPAASTPIEVEGRSEFVRAGPIAAIVDRS